MRNLILAYWSLPTSVGIIWRAPTSLRRGGRVVEGTGLENRQGVKALEGSNPSLSARRGELRLFVWAFLFL